MNLFDYLKKLTEKTGPSESSEDFEREYSPFMINRFFSCDRQLVFLANEMNKSNITKRMHFGFMNVIIPKGKRYIKYDAKKTAKDQAILNIMEYYKCSSETAKSYLKLLDEPELQEIHNALHRHGRAEKAKK